MSWFQENKFAAGLLGATVVVSGGLFYLGMSARSTAEESREEGANAVTQANRLRAAKPFPNGVNKKALAADVQKLIVGAESFQKQLLTFRPDKLATPSPANFSKKLADHRTLLTTYFKSKGVAIPSQGVGFGFEKYTSSMASAKATRELEYQRQALEWMFKALADSQPDSLDNIHRHRIASELSEPTGKKKSKKKGGSTGINSVYQTMPIEIAFTGSEASLKRFVEKLANSDKFLFSLRALRVNNEVSESPKDKVEEVVASPLDDGFGDVEGLEGSDDGGSAEKLLSDEPILKQVLGAEKVKAHLKIDLLLLLPAEEVKFPAARRPKKPKKGASGVEKYSKSNNKSKKAK